MGSDHVTRNLVTGAPADDIIEGLAGRHFGEAVGRAINDQGVDSLTERMR